LSVVVVIIIIAFILLNSMIISFLHDKPAKKTKSTITLMKSGFEQNETQQNSANYDCNKHEKA
jgi:hypothetical protein